MDLSLSSEQEMIRKTARDFLTEQCPKKVVKEIEESELGYLPEMWGRMAELGWMGLPFPEKYSGGGMTFLDLAILLEEMGRACLSGPFFSSVVLGGLPILVAGNKEQKKAYLPKIATGKSIFTLALTELDARYDAAAIKLEATKVADGYQLDGTKLFVPDAHVADYLLCVAKTDENARPEEGITIFIVDTKSPGILTKVQKTAANDKLCEVIFDRVQVPGKESILGQLNQGWKEVRKILQRSAVAKCCEIVGGMQHVLEMTIDYAKERKQFDHHIGSFQAIQHHCTNMGIYIDGAKLITYRAAWMLSEGLSCAKEAAVAKAWTSEAYQRVIALAHQIHGGIGFTMEYDLQYYTRRAKTAEVIFGDADFWREVVAQEVGL